MKIKELLLSRAERRVLKAARLYEYARRWRGNRKQSVEEIKQQVKAAEIGVLKAMEGLKLT